jgi:hypothetical protein
MYSGLIRRRADITSFGETAAQNAKIVRRIAEARENLRGGKGIRIEDLEEWRIDGLLGGHKQSTQVRRFTPGLKQAN